MGKLLILLIFLSFKPLFGKEHVAQSEHGKVIFQTGESENSQRNFFGADLWFTGNKIGKKRNVMSIVLNSSDIKLETPKNKSSYQAHKNKMLKFAKKRGYEKVEFSPYKKIELENKTYHLLTWSYSKDGTRFVENSYYVECSPVFFIAKATTIDNSDKDQLKFKKIIEGAKCEK